MSNDYAQGRPLDNGQPRGLPWSDEQIYQPREGRLRASSAGSFSRRDPPPRPPTQPQSSTTPPPLPPQNPRRQATPPQRPQRPPAQALPSIPNQKLRNPPPATSPFSPTQKSRNEGSAMPPYTSHETGQRRPHENGFPSPQTMSPVSTTGGRIPSTYSTISLRDSPPELQPQALPPFPPPAQRQRISVTPPRARIPLGPPPSARRGPPSIYPKYPSQAYVSPIVEESDSQKNSDRSSLRPLDGSRVSYASSNAIPTGIPDYYTTPHQGRPPIDSYASEYDESDGELTPRMPQPQVPQETQQGSSPVLVRQASIGKRSKPTLTMIRPGDKVRSPHERTFSDDSFDDERVRSTIVPLSPVPPVQSPPGGPRPALRRIQRSSESTINGSQRTGSSDPLPKEPLDAHGFSSDSEDSGVDEYKMRDLAVDSPQKPAADMATPTTADARAAIMSSLEKGGALPASQTLKSPATPSSLANRIGSRRPPRINVDAVREAEQRGSLTSLPDLIRRATKLASNLDRGRTASRLGLDWMVAGGEKRASFDSQDRGRSGSVSDMISAFPPPAATPMSRGSGRFAWPAHLRNPVEDDPFKQTEPPQRPKRRVCGMRVWVFVLIILLVIALAAAAVLVPVFLIVVPNQNHNKTRSLASCQSNLVCANSGTNVLAPDGSCHCLCTDGFTGTTCSISAGTSCATVDVSGFNATAGDALPRLLSIAQTNYSLPLEPAAVLSLLAAGNMTCASQNSLVTFGSRDQRRSVPIPTKETDPAATSAGVVFATGTAPVGNGSLVNASPAELDFARVAVLFVLQDSGQVNEAFAAQGALEERLSGVDDGDGNVDLGDGYSADLGSFSVIVKNGTSFGGRG